MVFKNCPQGLPLKFQGASFGAIKFFWGEIFIGSLTGSEPEITIIIYSSRVFRPNVTYMACCWGSVLTEISVTWVMALKCQKKVRASSRKKAQLLSWFYRGKIGMNDQTQHTMIHCYWRHADIFIDVTSIHSRDYASTYFLQKQNLYSPSFIFTSGKGWT